MSVVLGRVSCLLSRPSSWVVTLTLVTRDSSEELDQRSQPSNNNIVVDIHRQVEDCLP